MKLNAYRSTVNMTKWLTQLFVVWIVIHIIVGLTHVELIRYCNLQGDETSESPEEVCFLGGPRGANYRIDIVGFSVVCLSVYSFTYALALMVLILVWLFHSYKNLKAFGIQGLMFSPGLAVLLSLVPVLSFLFLLLIMIEIWNASKRYTGHNEDWRKEPLPILVMVWWLLQVVTSVVDILSSRFLLAPLSPAGEVDPFVTLGQLMAQLAFLLAGSSPAMIATIILTRTIAAWQSQMFSDLQTAVRFSKDHDRPLDEVLAMYVSGMAWVEIRKWLIRPVDAT